jgi:formate dehydrogenase accessory protein FdhE
MKNPWQQRIHRAEELATAHPFAAEMLRFYALLTGFQAKLYRKLETASSHTPMAASHEQLAGPPELPSLLSSFGEFLSFIEEVGPARSAEIARGLKGQDQRFWGDFLNQFWSATAPDSPPAELLFARAFLQPYAELLRHRAAMQWPGYSHSLCPFCNRKAGLGLLRQMGDGGQRSLICSFCMAEWNFRRIVCPSCGEEDHSKLPVYTAGEFDYIRVECCDNCRHYLKTVDLTKNGLADAVVDEIAAAPLDLWAREQGYSKIEPNLVGV